MTNMLQPTMRLARERRLVGDAKKALWLASCWMLKPTAVKASASEARRLPLGPTRGEDHAGEAGQVPHRDDEGLDVKSTMRGVKGRCIQSIGDRARQRTGEAPSLYRRGTGGDAHKRYFPKRCISTYSIVHSRFFYTKAAHRKLKLMAFKSASGCSTYDN